jgi:hypothetical protein
MTTHAAAIDCQRRAKSGRRVSRHRTGLSETAREVPRVGLAGANGGGASDAPEGMSKVGAMGLAK